MSIWGTSPDAIDEAEDRDRWMELLKKLDIRQPEGGVATNEQEALAIANKVGGGGRDAGRRLVQAELELGWGRGGASCLDAQQPEQARGVTMLCLTRLHPHPLPSCRSWATP